MGAYRDGLSGVGGWLAFLVVTLALSALAAIAVSIGVLVYAGRLPPSPAHTYMLAVAAIGVASGAGYGWLAWLLNTRLDARTPRIAIAGLWLLALLPTAALVAAAAVLLGTGAASGNLLGADAIRPIVYAAVWTAYLLRSVRVANTYAPREDALATVFH